MTFRPATTADLTAVYGSEPPGTVLWAWCAENKDGDLIGIGGVAQAYARRILFLQADPELRRHKVALVKAIRRFMDDARERGVPTMYANAEPGEPAAEKLMRSLGMEPTTWGEGWIWHN